MNMEVFLIRKWFCESRSKFELGKNGDDNHIAVLSDSNQVDVSLYVGCIVLPLLTCCFFSFFFCCGAWGLDSATFSWFAAVDNADGTETAFETLGNGTCFTAGRGLKPVH